MPPPPRSLTSTRAGPAQDVLSTTKLEQLLARYAEPLNPPSKRQRKRWSREMKRI